MKHKRIVSCFLSIVILVMNIITSSAISFDSADVPEKATIIEPSGNNYDSKSNSGDVILNAWCWSFNTIKENMANIANAGYTAVQTSPANACCNIAPSMKILGCDTVGGMDGAWWWNYEPTDFSVGNYQLGTADEYKAMCDTASEYGIKIITDVVVNHTARDVSALSDNLLNAVGIHNRPASNDDSEWLKLFHDNWTSTAAAPETREGETLYNVNRNGTPLPDLNTENAALQAYIVDYLNELIRLGCDGFHFVYANNIAAESDDGVSSSFWPVAVGNNSVTVDETVHTVNNENLFIYGDVSNDKYKSYMKKTDATYRSSVINNIMNGAKKGISGLDEIKTNTVYSVESCETYFNDTTTDDLTDEDIVLAWALIAARMNSTPLFFSRPDGSDISTGNYRGNNVIGAVGNDTFMSYEIAAINKFHNSMIGQGEEIHFYENNAGIADVIAIERFTNTDDNGHGICFINLSQENRKLEGITTHLTNGRNRYVDIISGNTFTAELNKISIILPARSIALLRENSEVCLSAVPNEETFTDSLDVTLGLQNGSDGHYKVIVDGVTVDENDFNDGDKITIGENVDVSVIPSKKITLNLICKDNSNRNVNRNYTYTKEREKDAVYLYFDNSGYNWDTVFVTIKLRDVKQFDKQLKIDYVTGYYKVEVPAIYNNGNITFYDQNNRELNTINSIENQKLKVQDYSMLLSYNTFTKYSSAETIDPITAITKYNHIYFFNSINNSKDFYITLKDGSNDAEGNCITVKINYSEDMHCFYYVYDSGKNFTQVSFTDCDKINIPFVDIEKGKVFAAVGFSSGEWIPFTNIVERTIYLDTNNIWNDVNMEMSNGYGAQVNYSAENGIKKLNDNIYSLTYYYPATSNLNKDYSSVTFINGENNIKMNIPSDKPYMYRILSNNECEIISNYKNNKEKNIAVDFSYYYEATANSKNSEEYIENTCTREINLSTSSVNLDEIITIASGDLDDCNQYDQYYFETSQTKYVTSIAARTNDIRLSSGFTYGDKLDPICFSPHTSSFSGIHSSDLGEFNNVPSEKWVTYWNGENEVDRCEILPDLSNITKIKIWGFSSPKDYSFALYYPTTNSELKSICGKELFIAENNVCVSGKTSFNQLGMNNELFAEDMANFGDYVFDGWYKLIHTGNEASSDNITGYIKVSSDKNYKHRMTEQSLELYAVFRPKSTTAETGCSALNAGVDITIDDNNTQLLKYNTIINVYDITQNDTITDVGVAYVKFNNSEMVNNVDIDDIREEISKLYANDIKTGKTTISINDENVSCNIYKYSTTNDVILTNKNRIQFVLKLTKTQSSGSYSDVAAFTACKINGKWQISNNYVYYKNGQASYLEMT